MSARTTALVALLFAGGCFKLNVGNDQLHCAASGACPSGFHCVTAAGTCWRNGEEPDLGVAVGNDGGSSGQNGDACAGAGDCASGHCVDGVCCATACTGACQACNTPAAPGTCANVAADATPLAGHDSCPKDAVSTCQHSGKCDANGGCALYDLTAICLAESCSGGLYTQPSTCNGTGTCVTPAARACDPYVCNGNICFSNCTTSAQCLSPHACDLTMGTPGSCGKKGAGATCAGGTECQSNNCVDGVCCTAASCGNCQACNVIGFAGSCHNVLGDGTPEPHGGCQASTATCAAGGCGNNSGACKPAAVNTVCSQTCAAGCQPCDGTTCFGQCTAALTVKKCDGVTASCSSGGTTTACASQLVCADATTCRASCTYSGDCQPGYYCSGGTCTPQKSYGQTCTALTVEECPSSVSAGVGQCVGMGHICGACALGTCPPSLPRCDGSGPYTVCAMCTTNTDCALSETGSVCAPGGKCTCVSSNDCTSPQGPSCNGSTCACGAAAVFCTAGQVCNKLDATGICKLAGGQVCAQDVECVSGICTNGFCAKSGTGVPCRFSGECASGTCGGSPHSTCT